MQYVLTTWIRAVVCLTPALFSIADNGLFAAEPTSEIGFAKVDITPTEPVRLSGYANRDQAYEGVDEPLHARAMAIRTAGETPCVLVSVDTIGFPGVLTREIHDVLQQQHGLPRANFVLACTHSHTAPQIDRGLDNIYSTPLNDDERARTAAYTERVRERIIQVVADAIADLKPGRLFTAAGEAHFAVNRRVIRDGKWTGFGINPAGPIDHALPVLKITDPTGRQIRGLVFNYACHCTTFGGDYNRVNGDWAGYAAKYLEEEHPEATAICTIGCGADANPERVPARAFMIAQAQGREISDEVARLIAGPMTEVTAPLRATYGFAGLPIDRPSREELRERLNDTSPQVRRHADTMLEIRQRMGRLPETYPMPIQVWRFGDQYTMAFLGGEVVAEYALRIKREFTPENAAGPAWVTAYANDVFGYVASERMRDEGGYEVDYSMIFYNQPGRWSSGTEDVILRRIHELYLDNLPNSPLSPEASLPTFKLPQGLAIGIVAAEPLIADPISFEVGPDGRLWVVEMGDYPRGAHDDGAPGGRIRVLTDVDHDGRYDEAVTFLDDLAYPTGVMPWRNGAIISGAPDIIYAEDTDGDGRADVRRPLFHGYKEANPQHRVNGFAYGLDNWLYLAGGDSSGDITSVRTGTKTNVSRRDSRIDPDNDLIEAETGRSQYGRVRNDWGDWFGNENSRPLYHYVLSDRYFARNPHVPAPQAIVRLYDEPGPPPVYPASRTVDRFNDLFTENRFTSACSPHIFRDTSLRNDLYGAALICEPVHNLVSRQMLKPDGTTFAWSRHPDEQSAEFLASTDNWFRPTHMLTAPDGTLWVSDMYRMVIEHPEWIPEAWQSQLNLYAGNDRGRIYRVYRKTTDQSPTFDIPDLTRLDDVQLARLLTDSNGWRRDTAQMLLIQRETLGQPAAQALRDAAVDEAAPLGQVHALNILNARGLLRLHELTAALRSAHPLVVREALRISETHLDQPAVLSQVVNAAQHANVRVQLQAALTLGESDDPRAADALANVAADAGDDRWVQAAVVSSALGKADGILATLLARTRGQGPSADLIPPLVSTALADEPVTGFARLLDILNAEDSREVEDWQMNSLAACIDALQRHQLSLATLAEQAGTASLVGRTKPTFSAARATASDENAPLPRQLAAARLLGRGADYAEADRRLLAIWLAPQVHRDLQSAAIAALSRLPAADTPELLLENWPAAGPQQRASILEALLTRAPWTEALLAAIADDVLTSADLDAATRTRLSEHPQDGIRTRAAKLLGAPASADRAQVIADYQSVYELTGDPQRGAAAFKQRCAACHQHHGIGNNVGAQLSALTNKSTEFLLTAVLDPNRAVEYKYRAYEVLTVDGRVYSGMIVEESATSLTLAKADGTRDTILRSDIDELHGSRKSFMPEGLEKDVTPQNLADIFSFIQSAPPAAP